VRTQPTVLIVEVVCEDRDDGIDWKSSVGTETKVLNVEVVCEDTADGIDCGGRL
jgi:hypothetical protein